MAARIQTVLRTIPVMSLTTKLVRTVAFNDLTKASPPDWLYTSGHEGRFNPENVHCLYMSEDVQTAIDEYNRRLCSLPCRHQPNVLYWADVNLTRVLDLTNATVMSRMSLRSKDMEVIWQKSDRLTKTQVVGRTVALRSTISAIRFPSVAAKEAGHDGVNVVIFRDRITKDDHVNILGPDGKPIQTWP